MAKVHQNKYGKYIKGIVILEIEAYVTNAEEGDVIDEKQAKQMLSDVAYELARSNTGSEMLMNADVVLVD